MYYSTILHIRGKEGILHCLPILILPFLCCKEDHYLQMGLIIALRRGKGRPTKETRPLLNNVNLSFLLFFWRGVVEELLTSFKYAGNGSLCF